MKNAKKNNLQGNVIASLLDMIKTFINSETGRADMEKHTHNHSSQKVQEGDLQVWGQPKLHKDPPLTMEINIYTILKITSCLQLL